MNPKVPERFGLVLWEKIQLWKEQNSGFVEVWPPSFPAPRWNGDDGTTKLARDDLRAARRAPDPSCWTWTGIPRWEIFLDETFQPSPAQRRLHWKLIKNKKRLKSISRAEWALLSPYSRRSFVFNIRGFIPEFPVQDTSQLPAWAGKSAHLSSKTLIFW